MPKEEQERLRKLEPKYVQKAIQDWISILLNTDIDYEPTKWRNYIGEIVFIVSNPKLSKPLSKFIAALAVQQAEILGSWGNVDSLQKRKVAMDVLKVLIVKASPILRERVLFPKLKEIIKSQIDEIRDIKVWKVNLAPSESCCWMQKSRLKSYTESQKLREELLSLIEKME